MSRLQENVVGRRVLYAVHCLDCDGVKPCFSNSTSHCPMVPASDSRAKAMSLTKRKASNASGRFDIPAAMEKAGRLKAVGETRARRYVLTE